MSRSRTRDFSRVVFFVSCVSACQRLSHAQHVHVAQPFVSSHKQFVFTLSAAWHTVHLLMIPPSLTTSSFLICIPIRPSTRPSTGPLQISSSDEIYHCDDPTNVSIGSLTDLHSPTDYEALALMPPWRSPCVRCVRSVVRGFFGAWLRKHSWFSTLSRGAVSVRWLVSPLLLVGWCRIMSNFSNSNTVVGWLVSPLVSRPTVTRVTFDMPESK